MKKLFSLLALIILSACSTNHGTFTVLSKNIVDLDNLDLSTQQKVKNVEGESTGYIAIVFPFGELNPNIESAMTDAFNRTDGDLFTNATVKSYGFYIPYIYGQFGVSVEGEVIKTRR